MNRRRQGITLMEVLVAIIICGVGLLALMTLFPLGALEMAQSVRDDRCGHFKHSIAAQANIMGMRGDALVTGPLLAPGGGLPTLSSINLEQGESVSYPVFVDPMGWHANQGDANWRDWVGGLPGQTPRRVCNSDLHPTLSADLQFLAGNPLYVRQQLRRACVFLDEINFRSDDETAAGKACPPGQTVERIPRYSCAWMFQMPRVRVPTQVDLTVVLYSGRSLDDSASGEKAYAAYFNSGASTITLSWQPGQRGPDLPIGTWVLDAGMSPYPRGRFHRVVAYTPTGPNSVEIEVINPPTHSGAGLVVVMENVIEVYDRGDF